MENKNDKQIQELWDIVKKQKSEIEKANKPTWSTNGSFPWAINTSSDRLNIQVCNDVNTLIAALALLLEKSASFEKAAKTLEVKGIFTWSGYSLEEWQNDFKSRVDKIQITAKKEKLTTWENRLNELISPERKLELELEEIKQQLSK